MQIATTPTSPPSVRAPRRAWAALTALVLAVTLLAIDGTVLVLAVPALTSDLDASATQVLWIGDVYSLVLAGLLVTMGNLADRIGRKRLLMLGAVAFGAASVLAAFAPSPEVLIAARVLLGVAGATIMPSTLSIIRNLFDDPRERTRAIAIWSAATTAGAALGPLVGGVLLENFWWGSVFLINVPVMILLLAIGIPLLPESRNPSPGPFDLFSAALSVVAAAGVVYAIKTVAKDGFTAPAVSTLLVGAAAALVFVQRQRRAAEPLLDIALFRQRRFTGAVIAAFMSIFALTGLMFFFSQYLQLVLGHSALGAGLREMPATIASLAVPLFASWVAVKLGLHRALASGLIIAAAGMTVIAVAESGGQYLWLAVGLAVIGVGTSLSFTLTTNAVMGTVAKERAGAASAIVETAYEFGVALGIAVLGSIHAGLYTRLMADVSLPDDVATATRDSLAGALRVVEDPAIIEQAKHAFVQAMQADLALGAALLVAAGVVAWITLRPRKQEPTRAGSARS